MSLSLRWGMLSAAMLLLGAGPSLGQTQANPHGSLPPGLDCAACHTPNEWSPTKAVLDFDHGITAFPLLGSHVDASCTNCHLDLDFGTPRIEPGACVSCHLDVHQATLSDDCSSCHTTVSFQDLPGVDIHTRTQFPLTGAHLQISCESCHTNDAGGAFAPMDVDCVSCHQADYERTEVIDHQALGFPSTCERCHGTLDWSAAENFDHGALANGFALLGAHARAECASCHVLPTLEPLFRPTSPQDCVTCHQEDYDSEHTGSGFPTECASCHSVESWDGAAFDHLEVSGGFPLLGRHAQAECSTCHVPPNNALVFNTTDANNCVACHQADYDAQHGGTGFPTDCASCHSVQGWEGAAFDHQTTTGFALLGRHAQATCASCHSGAGFTVPFSPQGPNDCVACHQSDYDGEHAGSGFPTDCLNCHTTNGWGSGTVDHVALSNGFELLGRHLEVSCSQCHSLPNNALPWSPSSNLDCVACHQNDYTQQHAGSGFSTTCLNCHTTATWRGATFDHATAANGFQLVGAHATNSCSTCHTNPDGTTPFVGVPQDSCIGCHQTDYDQRHAGTGFSTNCVNCHNNNTWTGATFDHATAANGFQLVGAHATNSCATCHTNPDGTTPWTGVPQDNCIACHQNDYNSRHAGTGYPTTCLSCHNNNTWTGATFDHATVANGFQLVGAHAQKACATCHTNPDGTTPFTGVPQDNCIACHQNDYNNRHAGTGYPTTCLGCHNQNTWTGAVFNHDGLWFPIYSGKHQGKWSNDCMSCHTNPNDYKVFTCLNCHEHNDKSKVDADHSEVGGYAYDSNLCYSCHADGQS